MQYSGGFTSGACVMYAAIPLRNQAIFPNDDAIACNTWCRFVFGGLVCAAGPSNCPSEAWCPEELACIACAVSCADRYSIRRSIYWGSAASRSAAASLSFPLLT